MADEMNIPLLILDFLILLPISLLRLGIIYMYGSRYNIPNMRVLDVMMHANEPNFNKGLNVIRTEKDNINDVVIEMVDPDNPKLSKKKLNNINKLDHITNVINNIMSENEDSFVESSDDELEIIDHTNSTTDTETEVHKTQSIKFTDDVNRSNVDIFDS